MNCKQKQILNYMYQFGATKDVATYVAAQATLESGNFTSEIYKENKNFMGMKEAHCRLTTAKGSNRNHAKYYTEIECMADYILWLVYNGFTQNTLKDLDRFKLRLVNSGYCPAKDYIKRIDNIYEQIKETRKGEQNENTTGTKRNDSKCK